MGELTTGHMLMYVMLIVVTMGMLDWVESKRIRAARARRGHRGQLEARPARKAA
jgi:hypothetical protein